MSQKKMDSKNNEIKSKAYELYENSGFKDGNDFGDWLNAEKQLGKSEMKKQTAKRSVSKRSK